MSEITTRELVQSGAVQQLVAGEVVIAPTLTMQDLLMLQRELRRHDPEQSEPITVDRLRIRRKDGTRLTTTDLNQLHTALDRVLGTAKKIDGN